MDHNFLVPNFPKRTDYPQSNGNLSQMARQSRQPKVVSPVGFQKHTNTPTNDTPTNDVTHTHTHTHTPHTHHTHTTHTHTHKRKSVHISGFLDLRASVRGTHAQYTSTHSTHPWHPWFVLCVRAYYFSAYYFSTPYTPYTPYTPRTHRWISWFVLCVRACVLLLLFYFSVHTTHAHTPHTRTRAHHTRAQHHTRTPRTHTHTHTYTLGDKRDNGDNEVALALLFCSIIFPKSCPLAMSLRA